MSKIAETKFLIGSLQKSFIRLFGAACADNIPLSAGRDSEPKKPYRGEKLLNCSYAGEKWRTQLFSYGNNHCRQLMELLQYNWHLNRENKLRLTMQMKTQDMPEVPNWNILVFNLLKTKTAIVWRLTIVIILLKYVSLLCLSTITMEFRIINRTPRQSNFSALKSTVIIDENYFLTTKKKTSF